MNRPVRSSAAIGISLVGYFRCALLLALFAGGVPSLLAAPALPLQSPWDGKLVTATNAPYSCPALAHLGPDLVTDGFYRLDDPTHSIIDPVRQEAYNKSSGVVKSVGIAVVNAADDYRITGSKRAAQCVIDRIATLAHDKSLSGKMSSNQAYYVQGWVVGAVAIAYLKVRSSADPTPGQADVSKWLLSVGQQTKDYYDAHRNSSHGDNQNNHLYWAGVELAAIAVAANDRTDFKWALAAYDNGVDQIGPDGTLPLEMARGKRALHYHLYALAPLVLLAEFGEANGLDLYSHANGAIHRLVNTSVAGLNNPAPFEKATGQKQEMPARVSGDQIGWAPPYVHRFANPELARMIKQATDLSVYYLGGLPPN